MQIQLVVEGAIDDEGVVPYDERAVHAAADAARAALDALRSAGVTVTSAHLSSGHFMGGTLDLLA